MRWFNLLFVAVFLPTAITSMPLTASAEPPQLPAKRDVTKDTSRKTVVYRLENAAVQDVARVLNEELQEKVTAKPQHDGFIVDSPVILIPEVVTNRLLVSALPPYLDQVAERIATLDKQPDRVMISAKITKITPEGEKVLSRPQIMVMDGQEATVELGSTEKRLRIELTPWILTDSDTDAAVKVRR